MLDGAYPGGDGTEYYYTYALGLLNLLLAVLIARGSERWLFLRIPAAAVLFLERLGSVYAFGIRSNASVAVHLVTALVEFVILVTALSAWRLGRSLDAAQLDTLFALEVPPGGGVPGVERPASGAMGPSGRVSQAIALLTLGLVGALITDGVIAGFVPDGTRPGLEGRAAGWYVYLLAVVVLIVSLRAVHGSRISLWLLLVTAFLLLLERPLSPLALGRGDVPTLAVHGLGALIAVGLLITAVAGLRAAEARYTASVARILS